MYLWLNGEATCENEITGHKAIINLKPKGFNFWSEDDYNCEGEILNSKGKQTHIIKGDWSSHFNALDQKKKRKIKLVKRIPLIENREE